MLAGVITIGSLGVGACGGVWYQKTQINAFGRMNGQQYTQNGTNGQRSGRMMGGNNVANGNVAPGVGGGMMGRGAVTGEVTAKDDKSITIKMNDGSSKIVILGSNITYTESTTAKPESVSIGSKVAVFGTTTADGTTTATSVELNPALRGQTTK